MQGCDGDHRLRWHLKPFVVLNVQCKLVIKSLRVGHMQILITCTAHMCTIFAHIIYIYVYLYVYYVNLNMLLLFIYNYILYTHLNTETYTPIFTLNNHVYIKNTLYLKACV